MAKKRAGFGNTTRIGELLQRVEAGDRAAREELLAESQHRLTLLASKMLKQFPRLVQQGRVETGLVLNDALLKLYNSFDQLQIQSPEHFINLAAQKIRFCLLDLARKYKAEMGAIQRDPAHDGVSQAIAPEAAGHGDALDDLADPASLKRDNLSEEDWADFHLAVERLSQDELQVFTLRYYGNWSREETATILGVNEKTVSRRYGRALDELARLLKNH